MIMSKHYLASIVLLLLLQACKHPLAIVGEGDIVDANGTGFGCTLEQFQAGDPACLDNEVVDNDYLVNYTPVPRPGWKFVRWEGACGHLSEGDNCRFEAPSAAVALFDQIGVDTSATKITAVFERENALLTGPAPAVRGGAPAVWIGEQNRAVFFGGMSPITGDTPAPLSPHLYRRQQKRQHAFVWWFLKYRPFQRPLAIRPGHGPLA